MAENETPLQTDRFQPAADLAEARRRVNAVRAFTNGLAGLGAALALSIVAFGVFGSSEDGNPMISLALSPFPRSPVLAAQQHEPSFVNSRVVNGYLVADPKLIEDSAQGPLPAIAPDGRTPVAAYGMPINVNDKRPKIAIIVDGLGIGAKATADALMSLPPQITLGIPPYADEIQMLADKARGAGHEVLLEVPMEPFDFPDSDPGPHALLVAASAEENARRLDWAMSRFTGYVGLTHLLGARFLGEMPAIEPVLTTAAKRGVMFFDDGTSARSLAMTAARHAGATIASGNLVLDGVQSQSAIDARLGELETIARRDGSAIGVASLYPVTIARLSAWASNAGARGFLLVPITALASRPIAPGATASAK
jgi:hypothetical protein